LIVEYTFAPILTIYPYRVRSLFFRAVTQGGRAYMQGLLSIWQTDLVDVATAAIKLIEREVIEVDVDIIEVEVN
jgi:hypothetical protein